MKYYVKRKVNTAEEVKHFDDSFELNGMQKKFLYKDMNDTNTETFNALIGRNKVGQDVSINFEKTPHILVGGASGSGKSCLMNCIITSLLNKYEDFYLTIIDLKQVEFVQYAKAKQLATSIVNTSAQAYTILDRLITIMTSRYNYLAEKGYKDIKEWNANEEIKMYRHVVVVDELAHLLLENKHIKEQLQKLLQLGRAVGIHLILATQSPNCKTIPTELKINITCRIALQVPTSLNSKIIIDEKGAESLKGNGDALIRIGNTLENFQVALV